MTLVETLLALALVLALGGLSLRFLGEVGGARARAGERDARLWGTGLLMEHLEQDLLCALAKGGPAVVGDAQRLAVTTLRLRGQEPAVERRSFAFDGQAGAVVLGEAAAGEVLVPGVAWMALRYLGAVEWHDATAMVEGAAPRAVEVRLWYGPNGADGEPQRAPDRRRVIPLLGVDGEAS